MISGWTIFLYTVVLAPLIVIFGFAPRSTVVVGNRLLVHSWVKTFQFDLTLVTSVEEVDRDSFSWKNTIRIFGVGWPLKPYGWFWNREYGVVLAMVTDPSDMLLLSLGSRQLLVSPRNERDLILRLQKR